MEKDDFILQTGNKQVLQQDVGNKGKIRNGVLQK
jgi:hypothetical protein